MKYLAAVLAFLACSAPQTPSPKTDCLAPPEESDELGAPGYLVDCGQNDTGEAQCCGYGTIIYTGDFCFHIVCQAPVCAGEWLYRYTFCPGSDPTLYKGYDKDALCDDENFPG